MKVDGLAPAVIRVESIHACLATGLWIVLLPTGVVQSGALFAGAAFMGINFLLLSCGIQWVLTPFAGRGRVRTGILLLMVKMALFLGLTAALLLRVQLEPLSFTLGFSSLLVAIVCERAWAARALGA